MRITILFLAILVAIVMTNNVTADITHTEEKLQVRVNGDSSLPTIIYLPGLHGDWTLASSFRRSVSGKVRLVEFTYPRTLTWSLDDYASAIARSLHENGITNGWLLGESFGSQIVWPLAVKSQSGAVNFRVEGIILAGGFVRHPNRPGIQFLKHFTAGMPYPCFRAFLACYSKYAKLRHHRAPETLAQIDEFVSRRTQLDRIAMRHRLCLIEGSDARNDVRKLSIPVYALSGFWDPIVPRWLTKVWLRNNCPSFHAAKTIYTADHNVLGTQPDKSAEIILSWIRSSQPLSQSSASTTN